MSERTLYINMRSVSRGKEPGLHVAVKVPLETCLTDNLLVPDKHGHFIARFGHEFGLALIDAAHAYLDELEEPKEDA